jgi:hypothetical protein
LLSFLLIFHSCKYLSKISFTDQIRKVLYG